MGSPLFGRPRGGRAALFVTGLLAVPAAGQGSVCGDFETPVLRPTGDGTRALALVDLGDDSSPRAVDRDLAVVAFGSSDLTTLTTFEGGAFAGVATCGIAAGNLDSDLTPDLVAADYGGDGVSILRAIPCPLAQPYGTGCAGTPWVTLLDTVGLPAFGNGTFALGTTNALPSAIVVFAFSGSPASRSCRSRCSPLTPRSTEPPPTRRRRCSTPSDPEGSC